MKRKTCRNFHVGLSKGKFEKGDEILSIHVHVLVNKRSVFMCSLPRRLAGAGQANSIPRLLTTIITRLHFIVSVNPKTVDGTDSVN